MPIASLSPARSTALRNTLSAVGDRQMLPRHTNSTRAAGCAGPVERVMLAASASRFRRKRHAEHRLLELVQAIAQFGRPLEFEIPGGVEHFLLEPLQFLLHVLFRHGLVFA